MTATATRPLTTTEAIESRRSIRSFVQEPMNGDDLREILRLASLAPTAFNAQPTRFAILQNPEVQAQLQAAAFNQKQVTSAPAVIVVYSDMEDVLADAEATVHPGVGADQIPVHAANFRKMFDGQDVTQRGQWGVAQASIVFGFLMVAARGLGYDTSPMLGFEPDKVRDLLKLPAHAQIIGLLPIGKRAEQGHAHHRHNGERITTFY